MVSRSIQVDPRVQGDEVCLCVCACICASIERSVTTNRYKGLIDSLYPNRSDLFKEDTQGTRTKWFNEHEYFVNHMLSQLLYVY